MTNESRHPVIAWCAAAVILLTLCLRMTITETVRVAFADRVAALTDPTLAQTPTPGPAHTVAFTVVILLAAGAVIGTHRLSKKDWIFLAAAAVLSALMLASTFHAENKFAALIGTCDVILSLAACAALLVLGRDVRIKQLFIATVVALSVVWVLKSGYQYFVETPDTIKYIEENWAQILAQRGWQADDPQATLFMARVHSREITGYITFSNVVAAGMIPLILLLLALAWQFLLKPGNPKPGNLKPQGFNPGEAASRETPTKTAPHSTTSEAASHAIPKTSPSRSSPGVKTPGLQEDIPLLPVIAVLAILLAVASAILLILSDSKGGIGAFALCLPLTILGLLLPAQVARHRKKLLAIAGILMILGAAAVVSYGLKKNGLPTLSLLYRWHYWQGSAQIVEHHPLLGVGLNNFGDYYVAVKPPQSPEDVKDPHSIFVRFAAECGLPVAVLIAALIFWLLARALRPRTLLDSPIWTKPQLIGVTLAVFLWWFIRLFVAELPDLTFNIIMAFLNAALAAGAAALTLAGLSKISGQRVSILLNVLVIGAAGMLLYDQINMGLTTGPVAMFFWCILTVGAAPDAPPENDAPRMAEKLAAGVFVAGALTLAVFVFGPLTTHSFAWDPTPWEDKALRATNPRDALENWQQALDRNPHSVEALRRRMQAKVVLGQPIEQDINQILTFNTTDARTWMDMGLLPSNLPPERRKEILERALWLDDLTPADQAKKLKPAERERINQALGNLPK